MCSGYNNVLSGFLPALSSSRPLLSLTLIVTRMSGHVRKRSNSKTQAVVELPEIETISCSRTSTIINFSDVEQFQDLSVIHWRTYMIIVAATASYFGNIAFLTSTSFWLTAITAEVGGKSISLWSSQSYQAIAASLGPVLGSIGDKVGRRWLVIIGLLFGVAACAIGGTAHTQNQIIAGSCVFGILFSVQGQMFAIVSEVLPRRHRGTAQIVINSMGTAGSVGGLFVGAVLVNNFPETPGKYSGWRGMYWFVLGLYVIAIVLIAVFYRPPPFPNPHQLSMGSRIFDFDYVGVVLFTGFVVPLMMGLIWGGGGAKAWNDVAVMVPLIVGCVFLVLLGVHQTVFKKDGLFHHGLFAKSRNFALCLAGLFVEGMVYITFNVYFGQLTAILFDSRPLFLALRFSAFSLSTLAISPFILFYVWYFKRVRELLILGYLLFIAAVAGLTTLTPEQPKLVTLYCCLAGLGFAAPISLLFAVAHLSVPPELLGLASSLLLTFRSIGGALGSAIAGAVFNSKVNAALPTSIASAALNAGLPTTSLVDFIPAIAADDVASASSLPGVTPTILAAAGKAVLDAYADSFHFVWYVILPFLVVATLGVAVTKSVKSEMTNIVDRPAETEVNHTQGTVEKGRLGSGQL